ncbi:putative PurR-regulated permease PerM [Pseudonocardia autotrophica]|uniref:Pheromone autoinducer 2 transporter n=3 Tax=Pseudonocardiaceae TaxID=2070 RepID=A0A1Y2MRQ0_PSEAH|nr:AI-2E family transporter [Pseudonocardia autotrophica]OSY37178.1 pheromone autoinducer 2 transporter [Pseudonocardia autotrophica]TDN74799.1 putative PurR-regulated permease PerM [Pseudonocardia autotrophica]
MADGAGPGEGRPARGTADEPAAQPAPDAADPPIPGTADPPIPGLPTPRTADSPPTRNAAGPPVSRSPGLPAPRTADPPNRGTADPPAPRSPDLPAPRTAGPPASDTAGPPAIGTAGTAAIDTAGPPAIGTAGTAAIDTAGPPAPEDSPADEAPEPDGEHLTSPGAARAVGAGPPEGSTGGGGAVPAPLVAASDPQAALSWSDTPQRIPGNRPAAHPDVPAPLRVASEICARMLIIAAGLALMIFLVIQLRVVVIPVAIAVLLAALLAPLVQWLRDRRVPRGVATGLVMVTGLAVLGGLLTLVVNTLVDGTADLIGQLTISVASLQGLVDATPFQVDVEQLGNQLLETLQENQEMLTSGAVSTAATVGEVLAGFALCLFALIFMLYDGRRMWGFLRLLAPVQRRERVDVAGRRAFASLVGYVRATVLVAIVDATGIGLGLWITGVPLALPLTALVFVGAFIPIVGAVVTGAIAVVIALVANGLGTALIVLGIVLAVQQLESHVLQPVLLGRAVRLHPLAVALAVAAGVVIAGIVGALLAVPLLAVLTAAVRSLVAPREVEPSAVDPLRARDGNPLPELPEPSGNA